MPPFPRHAPTAEARSPTPQGILLHAPRLYDLQVWLATGGREPWLRKTILSKARLAAGEAMLDVGCGTGALAIAAAQVAGPSGGVSGVDPSPEMIASARAKARRAKLEFSFETGAAQALPFPDDTFDLVTSTLMLHHLPRSAQAMALAESRRVLKRGGRVLVVDFASSSKAQGGLLHRLHHHGRVRPEEIARLVVDAGLEIVESGPLGMRDLHYVLAVKPGAAACGAG
jgi:ubiquinone/menaquinone biosynthesis C-methylase UbiE